MRRRAALKIGASLTGAPGVEQFGRVGDDGILPEVPGKPQNAGSRADQDEQRQPRDPQQVRRVRDRVRMGRVP